MINDAAELQYQKIVEICRKSQEIVDRRTNEIGVQGALKEMEPHESMWGAYAKEIGNSGILKQANFSGLLFNRARFLKHQFLDCDFSRSRWVFSFIENSDCSGSKFCGINTLIPPFVNSDCTNCDFTEAELNNIDLLGKNIFKDANFTNAKLSTSHSFFKNKKPQRKTKFSGAIMNGCNLVIKKELADEHNIPEKEIQLLLEQIFSPEQLKVMNIDFGGAANGQNKTSGCFIATAACGIDSQEVMILRHFRDSVLLNNALGRLFVRIYYQVSPGIASMIASSPKAKYIVRRLLIRPWAKFLRRAFNYKK